MGLSTDFTPVASGWAYWRWRKIQRLKELRNTNRECDICGGKAALGTTWCAQCWRDSFVTANSPVPGKRRTRRDARDSEEFSDD